VADEQALLRQAHRMDANALAQIHDLYYPQIFRYIIFRVGDRQVAEDLTSDVFLRFLDALQGRSSPLKSLRGWLYGVAGHIVSDYHRGRYRSKQVDLDDDLTNDQAGLEEQLDANLQREQLQAAVASLTEEQQSVIALRFGQGLPIKEVASIIDKSEGAVKQLQVRALGALARRLSLQGGDQ